MICSPNQWTGFNMITASVTKELNIIMICYKHYNYTLTHWSIGIFIEHNYFLMNRRSLVKIKIAITKFRIVNETDLSYANEKHFASLWRKIQAWIWFISNQLTRSIWIEKVLLFGESRTLPNIYDGKFLQK